MHEYPCGHNHDGELAKLLGIFRMAVGYAGRNIEDFTAYCHQNDVPIPRESCADDIAVAFETATVMAQAATAAALANEGENLVLDLENLLRGHSE
jgi:hypothetical protein